MAEKQLDIALVHELCPIDLQPMNEHIMMDTRLRTTTPLHDAVHGKAVGYSKHLCDKHKAEIGTGIYLIEVDKAKSDSMENPYRTGRIVGISRDAFERWFNVPAPENQWAFVESPIVENIQKQAADG
jgi:hypothetical protein